MFKSLVTLAGNALWSHKLRSGLTLLGVIVGFTSVMTILSALEGMMDSIEKELATLGPSTFFVSRMGGMITSFEQWMELNKRKPFKEETADIILDGCDLCDKLSQVHDRDCELKAGSTKLRDVRLVGASHTHIEIVDFEVAQGRFFSAEDDLYRRRVAFIGDNVREECFAGVDPIDKEIRVDGIKYTVIGLAKKRGSIMGESQDKFLIIPFATYTKQYGFSGRGIHYIVKATSVERLQEAMDQVRMVLRSERHVPYNKEDDFNMMTADDILAILNSVTKLFRLSLVGIASISLVVGGIVVMNIMMVSVTERTREIGIRKAVGARQRHILGQFLLEALMTTLSGGLIGIVSGFLLARMLMGWIDFDISPSMFAISCGLVISVGIGLIFGIYPAMKAARLDPIKALSYE